jgi:hypothetical protein
LVQVRACVRVSHRACACARAWGACEKVRARACLCDKVHVCVRARMCVCVCVCTVVCKSVQMCACLALSARIFEKQISFLGSPRASSRPCWLDPRTRRASLRPPCFAARRPLPVDDPLSAGACLGALLQAAGRLAGQRCSRVLLQPCGLAAAHGQSRQRPHQRPQRRRRAGRRSKRRARRRPCTLAAAGVGRRRRRRWPRAAAFVTGAACF